LIYSEGSIYEDSPIDYYWGIGEDHSGKNMLGLILMKVRLCCYVLNLRYQNESCKIYKEFKSLDYTSNDIQMTFFDKKEIFGYEDIKKYLEDLSPEDVLWARRLMKHLEPDIFRFGDNMDKYDELSEIISKFHWKYKEDEHHRNRVNL
jgi:hypothetical protein